MEGNIKMITFNIIAFSWYLEILFALECLPLILEICMLGSIEFNQIHVVRNVIVLLIDISIRDYENMP